MSKFITTAMQKHLRLVLEILVPGAIVGVLFGGFVYFFPSSSFSARVQHFVAAAQVKLLGSSVKPVVTGHASETVFTATPSVSPTLTVTPTPLFEDGDVVKLYQAENGYRLQHKLAILGISSELENAARVKAEDEFLYNYFAHVSPQGVAYTDFIAKSGYVSKAMGENLAVGYDSADQVFAAWVTSPEHNANLLQAQYKNMGISVLCHVNITTHTNACLDVMEFGG